MDEEWEWEETLEGFYESVSPYLASLKGVTNGLNWWRYEKKVKDYNFGSLIRTDARQEYGEVNTIFGE